MEKAIIKWMFWMWNFNSTGDFIQQCFGDEGDWMVSHLKSKFGYYYDRYGAYGVIPAFFGELDNKHRTKLIDWVMKNYQE